MIIFLTVTVLFAFNQRRELVCVTLDWLQTHNVRSSLFLLLVCDLHSNSMVYSEIFYILFGIRYFSLPWVTDCTILLSLHILLLQSL